MELASKAQRKRQKRPKTQIKETDEQSDQKVSAQKKTLSKKEINAKIDVKLRSVFKNVTTEIPKHYRKNLLQFEKSISSKQTIKNRMVKLDNLEQILIKAFSRKSRAAVKNEKKFVKIFNKHRDVYFLFANKFIRNGNWWHLAD